ncbi:manganese/zinc/iron transport system substrate-binding protein [Austwickia chelonae]|uniref:Putative ABC transporter substrate-binding protein n=1 Tax=Austwickia chelonae NBRC 105200 TaxID=1184607 RepID=K6VQK1_9MICO|nr:metal ABC transporter substrate-binding protein [Austwickia chelonae]GAB78984.1 putative ABC transporter substrate-binding protein [Austwickia chelonae NBRC 105200]SEV87816.1 manganese/zinc/iron transport system substrate-binding protein [Austwickia chelonae]
MSFAPVARLGLALTCVLALSACSTHPAGTGGAKEDKTSFTVFATTGYLGDLVKNLAPDAKITVMVKPGGDPHTYQPSTQDIAAMRDADVVVSNGAHLEAMMLDQLAGLGDRHLAVSDRLPQDKLLPWPEKDDKGNALHDPHIWNDPDLWKTVTTEVAKKLGERVPHRKDAIAQAATTYTGKIEATKNKVTDILKDIPQERRVLVTGHDAFNYFGRAFSLEVKATDFVTSEANMSATQLQELAAFVVARKIPTIFQDNLKNPQAVTSLEESVKALGGKVTVSDKELYADSLGDRAPADTYLGALESNATAVAEALNPKN